MAVHELLRLHIATDKFYIEPLGNGKGELLIIDRISQEIKLQKDDGQVPPGTESRTIHGLLGVIRLLAGPYLIVITKKAKVGEINGQAIWKVTGTEMISYKKTTFHLNEQQVQDNTKYVSMMEHVLGLDSFYFATTYDITHSTQRLNNTSPEFLQMALHERADARFVWNSHLLRELVQQPELSQYCLPVMLGFMHIKHCNVKGHSFNYILISRRQSFRAGTRYYMRGIDSEGHAANFVETEQIIEYNGHKCSFVQTRGSVPLYWYQYPNLKYKPDPVISQNYSQLDGFQRHFAAQIYNYGKQVILNLLDHKKQELKLVNAFGQMVDQSQNGNIRYEPFDFHKECRKMQWHRLSILLDRVQEDQLKFGYFASQGGAVISLQEGVFRTNCIDCLDRTNVVQGLVASRSLMYQFQKLGILETGEQVEDQKEFEHFLRNVWADNADACAKQYAGTGALKTDFTRTGKRTIWGLLKDGFNSAIRYFMNNFQDGQRQDSLDLFLGNYIVEESEGVTKTSPLRLERDWKYFALPAIFMVAFSMWFISILIPDEHPTEQIMYVFFWGGACASTLGAMYWYGIEFVDKPKLAQAKAKME